MKKILVIWLLLTAVALGDGMSGYNHAITYRHNYAVDSAQAYFVYNGDSSLVSLLPVSGSSHQFLYAASPTIDSVGEQIVHIEVYSGGAVIDTFWGTYLNIPDTTAFKASITAGTGAHQCTVYVYNTTSSVMVPSAKVWMENSSGTDLAVATTNDAGYAILKVNTGTVYKYMSLVGNVQTTDPETTSVTAPYTDTIEVTTYDPGSPTAGGTGRLYGWIYDINGSADSGVIVSAQIPAESFKNVRYGSVDISRFSRIDTTNASGYWYLDLYQYPNLTVNGSADTTVYFIIKAIEPSANGLIGGEIFSIQYKMPDSTQHLMRPGSGYDVSE